MGIQYPYNMQSYNNQNLNNLNNISAQNNLVPQELIRVNGLQGAQTYQMAPNSTVALFDGNSDIMYIKQTDGAGFGNIRKFSFTEILDNQQVSQPSNDFVSREEFENFKKEMMDYGKQFVQQDLDTIKSKSNNVKR